MRIERPRIGSVTLSIVTAAFLLFVPNRMFWSKALTYFVGHEGQLALLAAGLFLLSLALLTIFSVNYLIKPLFILLIVIAAAASYYQDAFGILVTRDMVQNVWLTTPSEAKHLITPDFVLHMLIFGVIPSALIAWVRVIHRRFFSKVLFNSLVIFPSLAATVVVVLLAYPIFASTFRLHHDLIGSLNPSAPVVAALQYAYSETVDRNLVAGPLGRDAKQAHAVLSSAKPVLTVIVVGETARAQNFGLNDYAKNTTPEVGARGVSNFTNVSSCGTATAVSLPCMFSIYPRKDYSQYKGLSTENLTDVLTHAGLTVKWFDNDTGAYRVADRIPYEFLPDTKDKRFCSGGECLDDILVDRLERELPGIKSNTVLILHQLGSHGPAYHQRYPENFERFKPACHTSQFADCSREEIVNAYDNTIAYTDLQLARIIDLLKQHTEFASSMLYLSDHGESLGENGIYLHGAPYFMAPSTQTHVPMFAWFSDGYQSVMPTSLPCLAENRDASLSHDNFFHTALGVIGVSTAVYDKGLDAFAACRSPVVAKNLPANEASVQ